MKSEEIAFFGAGCFWGMEYVFSRISGVLRVTSGFMGGNLKNPSYNEVCTGNTGHTETVRIIFDPEKISYSKLLDVFFRCHDPTSVDGQGPDIGSQYKSVIFYFNSAQKKLAEKARRDYEEKIGEKIATSIEKSADFYPAGEEHQEHYLKKGGKPYCHIIPKI